MPVLQADQVNEFIVRRLIENLVIECDNATQVVIKQDSAVGSDDGTRVLTAVGDLTVDITTVGAANGLDVGPEVSDTWYYIYMIMDVDTETVAGLLSASATAPTLPSGYTKKRLVGAVRNDGSSDFRKFVQRDRNVSYDAMVSLVGGSPPSSYTELSLTSVLPTEILVSVSFQTYLAKTADAGANINLSINGVDLNVYHNFGEFNAVPGSGSTSTNHFCSVVPKGSSVWYRSAGPVSGVELRINQFDIRL